MNKAILILDKMPECCEECRLINSHYDNEYGWQTYCGGDYHRIKEKDKKYFCSLKPLPPKKEEIDVMETITNGYGRRTILLEKVIEKARQQGYNLCLDEILGETENQDNKYQKQIDEVLGKDIVDKFFKGE